MSETTNCSGDSRSRWREAAYARSPLTVSGSQGPAADGARWSRRGVLAALTAGAAGTALAGCGPGRPAASAAVPVVPVPAGAGPSTVLVIRHAEKPAGAVGGVDPSGTADPEGLTTDGWARAGALVGLFAPRVGPVRQGLVRPTALMASDPGADGSRRPVQTLGPLAAALGVSVSATVHKSRHDEAAAAVRAGAGVMLVAWQHEDIPGFVAALGAVSPTPPSSWPSERFDVVWVLRRAGTGWAFAQVPQLLLAGDSERVLD